MRVMRKIRDALRRRRIAGGFGFSLLEVLVSSIILAILSVSVIHGLTTLELESRLAESRLAGVMLATDLREEILSRPPVDLDGKAVLGREADEAGITVPGRLQFDDQDDYQALVDRPASDVGGQPLSGMERIWRAVRVESVSAESPAGASVDTRPLGLRRFTVTVYKDQTELTHLVWLGLGQEK